MIYYKFQAGYYGFNANISFTFQAVKNLSAHPTYLRFELFCKLFSDFWVYLGIVKFMEIGNLEDIMLFYSETTPTKATQQNLPRI